MENTFTTMTLPNGEIVEAMFYAGVTPRTHGIAAQDPETGEWFNGGMFTSKAAAARHIAKCEKMNLHAHRVILLVD